MLEGSEYFPRPKSFEGKTEEVCLEEADVSWLAHLANMQEDAITPEWLDRANHLVKIGSLSLRCSIDPEKPFIREARVQFCGEMLGWDRDDHPLHNAYTGRWRIGLVGRLDTLIDTFRYLHNEGIDIVKLFQTTATNPGPGLRPRIAAMRQVGFDPVEIGQRAPILFSRTPRLILQHYALWRGALGDEAVKVLKGTPSSLSYARDKVMTLASAVQIYRQPAAGLLRNTVQLNLESLLLHVIDESEQSNADNMKFSGTRYRRELERQKTEGHRLSKKDKERELRLRWLEMSDGHDAFAALSRYFWSKDRQLRNQLKARMDPSRKVPSPFGFTQAWTQYARDHREELFPDLVERG